MEFPWAIMRKEELQKLESRKMLLELQVHGLNAAARESLSQLDPYINRLMSVSEQWSHTDDYLEINVRFSKYLLTQSIGDFRTLVADHVAHRIRGFLQSGVVLGEAPAHAVLAPETS